LLVDLPLTDGPQDVKSGVEDVAMSLPLKACDPAPDPRYGCAETSVNDAPCESAGRACFFRAYWSETQCAPGSKCPLTVLFAGGDAGCPTPVDQSGLARTALYWADQGFVFICAQPFYSATEMESQPYAEELPCIRALIDRVRSTAQIVERVDLARFSVQGISHGAYNVNLNYVSGANTGNPTHLVIYDGGGDIARTEATFWKGGTLLNKAMHARFVRRANGGTTQSPLTHPSTSFPYCAHADAASDAVYRHDSTDWACTSDPDYLGSAYSCQTVVTTAAWLFVACDDRGVLGPIDVPDREVECAAKSIESCGGRDVTYEAFADESPVSPGTKCDHMTCVTWACAAPLACSWIKGTPCLAPTS
jgi:hypothetical protein